MKKAIRNVILLLVSFWEGNVCKAVADGLVGQVLAGLIFLKVKTKFDFTKSK